MHKSTLTQEYVEHLAATGAPIDEEHVCRMDSVFSVCERFIEAGRCDANNHEGPLPLEDLQQRVQKVAGEGDYQSKRVYSIAKMLHAYYMIGYRFPK